MVDTQKVKEIVKEKQQEQQAKNKGQQSEIQNLLNTMKDEFRKVLPETIKPDRLFRIAITEMRMNPRLFDASKESLLGALMVSAQLGLEPGALGYCYLVPYQNKKTGQLEIQFQLGYKGILELVRRSGQVENIEARVVYEKDKFDFEYGLTPKLVHKPALKDRGKPVAVYAIARFKSGSTAFDVMSVDEIESIRKRSKSPDYGPWQTDWEAMAKKVIIKRLCKYLPLSVDVQRGLAVDETTKAARKDMQDEEEIIYEADLTDWDKVITLDSKETEAKEPAQETQHVVPQGVVAQDVVVEEVKTQDTKNFKNPFVRDE